MVMEAVAIKVAQQDKEAAKADEVTEWKTDLSDLEKFR